MKFTKRAYVKVWQNCPDTTDGDETELNDGYSTTADHDILIRTLGAHLLPLTRLDITAQHG